MKKDDLETNYKDAFTRELFEQLFGPSPAAAPGEHVASEGVRAKALDLKEKSEKAA